MAMTDWQPIDSATKDGQEVLIFLRSPWSRIELAKWFVPWGTWITGGVPSSDDEMYGIGSGVPTHWMPLPAPPTT